ncbi:MAG: hypothetical protein LBG88_03655, partial [Christensenellaceae bacterium]|nr:hypothetical protein [Christensenellaceae bacterium]
MPFNDIFLQNASKLIDAKSAEGDFAYMRDIIKKAIANIKNINPSDIDVYMHGSYANATNIFFPSRLEVCVQLKVPQYDFTATKEYYISHELPYGPQDFRIDLFNALSEVVANSPKQEQVEGPSCTLENKCIIVPKHGPLKHAVEVLPGLSFVLKDETNGGAFNGVLVYDDKVKSDIATFPKLHQANGQTKDTYTGGNFKRLVRTFKTLNTIYKRENLEEFQKITPARGYFIECLLFNIPNNLYIGKTLNDVFLKVINYLANASLENFVCQNLVWHLFGVAAE